MTSDTNFSGFIISSYHAAGDGYSRVVEFRGGLRDRSDNRLEFFV